MSGLYYGRGKDEDNKNLIEFLNEVFFKDDTNFLDLLPKIYKDQYRPAYNNFVVQGEDGEFRSAVGNFYSPMSVGGEDISTCCIGNVAVGEKYRSMGYMKELMQMSVDDMKNNGVDLAFLGGQRQRYGYFGFESAGTRYVFNANRQNIKHSFGNEKSGLDVESLDPNDKETIEKIIAINSSFAVYCKRTVENCYDVLCSWNCVPFVLKKDGEFVGYYSVHKNSDNAVQECGVTDKKYLKAMVLAIFENTDKWNLEFPTAPFETDKLKFYTENFEGFTVTGCESLLVYNFEKVIRAFMKAKMSYTKLCDGEIKVLVHGVNGDEKIRISVKNNVAEVESIDGDVDFELDHHEATRAFFSNYFTDRYRFSPNVQQWLPFNVYLSSSDTM